MDLFRADFYENSGVSPDNFWDDEDFAPELPPEAIGQDERRMQLRAHSYWANLRKTDAFPQITDLRTEDLVEFSANSVLLNFTGGIENPTITFLGERLAEECDNPAAIHNLRDIPKHSLLARIAEHYVQILAYQAPVSFEAEFDNDRGATMLYRGVLLPFAGADGVISHVLGVINWKELASGDIALELLREMRLPSVSDSVSLDAVSTPASKPATPASLYATSGRPALIDWLAAARSMARTARTSKDNGRQALYAAIGATWDFALAAEAEPAEYARLLTDSGLKVQSRAPMVPLVKLVFGPDQDKTRITEYATVLTHAQRLGIARGTLAGWLGSSPGGLKGLVYEERRMRTRRASGGKRLPAHEALTERLRRIRGRPLSSLNHVGDEFPVLLARRLANGEVVLLGEVTSDDALLERVARHLPG